MRDDPFWEVERKGEFDRMRLTLVRRPTGSPAETTYYVDAEEFAALAALVDRLRRDGRLEAPPVGRVVRAYPTEVVNAR
jgi:hypothetical protein